MKIVNRELALTIFLLIVMMNPENSVVFFYTNDRGNLR